MLEQNPHSKNVTDYLRKQEAEAMYVHPSMYAATAPSGPWPSSKGASILLCPQLVSSNLVFVGSVMQVSGQRPPALLLALLPILWCEISH